MQLPDIKHLRELLTLLRSKGVLQYASTDLTLTLSETAPTSPRKAVTEAFDEEDELSPEEEAERLLFYSATPPSESKS